MAQRHYYVYILASISRTVYVGMTNDLERRVVEHKNKLIRGFTSKYAITKLVHVEVFSDVHDAIAREKEIKGWRRSKKVQLIEDRNPSWNDLSRGWFDD